MNKGLPPSDPLDLAELALSENPENVAAQAKDRELILMRADRLLPELRNLITNTRQEIAGWEDFVKKCDDNIKLLKKDPQDHLRALRVYYDEPSENHYNSQVALQNWIQERFLYGIHIGTGGEIGTGLDEKKAEAESFFSRFKDSIKLLRKGSEKAQSKHDSEVWKLNSELLDWKKHQNHKSFCQACIDFFNAKWSIESTAHINKLVDKCVAALEKEIEQKHASLDEAKLKCQQEESRLEDEMTRFTESLLREALNLRMEIRSCAQTRLEELKQELEKNQKALDRVLKVVSGE